MAMLSIVAFAQGKQKEGVIYDAVITRVIDGDTVLPADIGEAFA